MRGGDAIQAETVVMVLPSWGMSVQATHLSLTFTFELPASPGRKGVLHPALLPHRRVWEQLSCVATTLAGREAESGWDGMAGGLCWTLC